MIFDIISIFPEAFLLINQDGVIARALAQNLFKLNTINPRTYTYDNYHRIDDKSYGGGGMVMKCEPLELALNQARINQAKIGDSKVIYLSPAGRLVNQELVNELSTKPGLILICGRYEGVDERFIKTQVDLEVSIGDFVVSGGELPAMLLIDGIVRQLPGVVNSQASVLNDSFMNGLLDYPHYTIPREYKGNEVPSVLCSGNHEAIRKWRLKESLRRTLMRRPELLINRKLTKEESGLLEELNFEISNYK